jgi:hypothetical protein
MRFVGRGWRTDSLDRAQSAPCAIKHLYKRKKQRSQSLKIILQGK